MKRRSLTIIALGLAATLAAASLPIISLADPAQEEWKAPARARKKNPIPADERSIVAGKVLYRAQCFSCHGPAGHGDGPAARDLRPNPSDLSDSDIQGETDGALFWKITNGRKPMPTFEKLIPENDRWHVINYLRSLAARGGKR